MKPLDSYEAQKLEIRSNKYKDAFSEVVKEKEKLSSTIGAIGSKYLPAKKGGAAMMP